MVVSGFTVLHFFSRAFSAKIVAKKIITTVVIDKNLAGENREVKVQAGDIKRAFLKNTQPLRSIFRPVPVGWSMRSKRLLATVTADASEFIQTMNDRYTKPSGNKVQSDKVLADQASSVESIKADNLGTNL